MSTQTEQEILEQKANRARERLLAVFDELDKKRHAFAHPLTLVKKQLPDTVYLVAGGIVAFAGVAAVATVVVRARAKRRRELRTRFRIERAPPSPGFSADVGGRAIRALVTFGLVQLGKTLITRAIKATGDRARNSPRLPTQSHLRREARSVPSQVSSKLNQHVRKFQ